MTDLDKPIRNPLWSLATTYLRLPTTSFGYRISLLRKIWCTFYVDKGTIFSTGICSTLQRLHLYHKCNYMLRKCEETAYPDAFWRTIKEIIQLCTATGYELYSSKLKSTFDISYINMFISSFTISRQNAHWTHILMIVTQRHRLIYCCIPQRQTQLIRTE